MIKIRLFIILLSCIVNNIESMDWFRSFPTFMQTPAEVALAAKQAHSEDPEESGKNEKPENISNFLEQFRQKSERIIADTKAKSQEFLTSLSPQKKVDPQIICVQLEEYSLDSDEQNSEASDSSDFEVLLPQKLYKDPREDDEVQASLLSPEKSRFIKYLGLGILSMSMSAFLYKFFKGCSESTTYRKRPWH